MKTFFTADLHFGHKNIIEMENRPFQDLADMEEKLIYNWNKKVSKGDEVYILGDFSFYKNTDSNYKISEKLNGNKYLILGNHDNTKYLYYNMTINSYYKEIKIDDKILILSHYPIESWNGQQYGSIHLHGHIHKGTHRPISVIENRYNVGVDVNNFEPVTLEEAIENNKKQGVIK